MNEYLAVKLGLLHTVTPYSRRLPFLSALLQFGGESGVASFNALFHKRAPLAYSALRIMIGSSPHQARGLIIS
jgi:hypothetical protein